MEKTMHNSQIVAIMKAMTDDAGNALFKKRLPAKLLYALRRSIPEIEKAYKVYAASLTDICGQYGATPDKLQCEDAAQQEQLMSDLSELLTTETEVNVYTVAPELLEKCGEGVYDPLSFADMDRLWWLIAE